MTQTLDAIAVLDGAEADLLCTFAEIPPPFPLRVPTEGATVSQRQARFGAARDRLAQRGLADHRGPLGLAAEFVHLLRNCSATVDLMVSARGAMRGGVVLSVREDLALLVTQDLRAGDGSLRIAATSFFQGVDELVRLVPDHPASMVSPFLMPRRALGEVRRAMAQRAATGDRGVGRDELDELLRVRGIDDVLARRMENHLQPVLGNGQAGLAVPAYNGDWQRTGEELRWLDTTQGRLRLADDSGEWVSVNPLGPDELRKRVRGLARELR